MILLGTASLRTCLLVPFPNEDPVTGSKGQGRAICALLESLYAINAF